MVKKVKNNKKNVLQTGVTVLLKWVKNHYKRQKRHLGRRFCLFCGVFPFFWLFRHKVVGVLRYDEFFVCRVHHYGDL